MNNYIQEVISLQNIKLTVKVLLASIAVFLITFFISDALFIWLIANIVLCWPLIYKKKGTEIASFMEKLNKNIDEKVSKSAFLMKIERNQIASEKKQL